MDSCPSNVAARHFVSHEYSGGPLGVANVIERKTLLCLVKLPESKRDDMI